MANTTFAQQNLISEGGRPVWQIKSPTIPQQGEIHMNTGAVPANVSSSAAVTIVARVNAPHSPAHTGAYK